MMAKKIAVRTLSKWIAPCLSIIILLVAAWFVHNELKSLSREAIFSQIQSISLLHIISALACVFGSYFCLTVYDHLALSYLNKKIPYRSTVMTAFIAYAIGHNIGFSSLSGGTVRYRIYTLFGLSASDVAGITFFISGTFALGISLLLGIALLLMPVEETAILNIPPLFLLTTSFILISFPTGYLIASIFARSSFQFWRWKIQLPHLNIALGQIGIAIAELFFASATLYVLLAEHIPISYFSFVGIYLLAMIAGIVSSVPGGIGVFEAVLLATLPQIDRSVLLATMVVYRFFYYLLPFGIAMTLFLWHELSTASNSSSRIEPL